MENKRQVIIESTATLLYEYSSNGQNLKLVDITLACKISKKTIYKLFNDKDTLIYEAYCCLTLRFQKEIKLFKKEYQQYRLAISKLMYLINVLCHITPSDKFSSIHSFLTYEITKVTRIITNHFLEANTKEFENNLSTMLYLLCSQSKRFSHLNDHDIKDYEMFLNSFSDMLYMKYKINKKEDFLKV